MKSFLCLIALLFVACGEREDGDLDPPQISVDVSPLWVGDRSIAEEAPPKEFNLQIRNTGEQTLTISNVRLRADQNCAFRWEGPDITEIKADDSAFIRGWYEPTVRGEDNVALVIESNSDTLATLVVPICGRGLLQEEIDQQNDEDTEGGTSSDIPICDVPPDDLEDCDEEPESK